MYNKDSALKTIQTNDLIQTSFLHVFFLIYFIFTGPFKTHNYFNLKDCI